MSPVIRANTLLLGLILLLGGLSWWLHQPRPDTYPRITSLREEDIQEIRILHKGRLNTHLRRHRGQWIRLPGKDKVTDEKWLRGLLHMASLPSLHRFPLDERRLGDFGLAPPHYSLQLNDLSLDFGSLDPVTRLRYLRVGNHIHLVTDSYTHLLNPDRMSDKTIPGALYSALPCANAKHQKTCIFQHLAKIP